MENVRWNSEKNSKLKRMFGNFELSEDRHKEKFRIFSIQNFFTNKRFSIRRSMVETNVVVMEKVFAYRD